MKKIINGKLYDTNTANELASASHGEGPRDFRYYSESLYRKKTGEFFLHGSGGPMTHYAVSVGQNSWRGGEKIIPLSYKAAQEWAEKNLDADDYQEIFGEVTEGDDVTICAKLPASIDAKLRRIASENGATLSATIARLIEKEP